MEKIFTDERHACHTEPCIHDGIHEVILRGVSFKVFFCCPHMDDLMYELGQGQPDGEIGFAKFRAEHAEACGYVGKVRE